MHLIPQSWSHLHILVSVFPSFGLVLVLGFYVTGFLSDNIGIKRTCLVLFGMLALLSVPDLFERRRLDGGALQQSRISQGHDECPPRVGDGGAPRSRDDRVAALVELWRSGRVGAKSPGGFRLVCGLAIVALCLMVAADGWEIHHRELQSTVSIPGCLDRAGLGRMSI